MSNGDGSIHTPKRSITYGRRSAGGRKMYSVYLEKELSEYAEEFCRVNAQSVNSLFNDLVRMLKDEL
jgi:DNA-directed RNA polymerase subunit F